MLKKPYFVAMLKYILGNFLACKTTHLKCSLFILRVVKFAEMEGRMVVVRDWEERGMELVFNGYRVSLGEDEKVLKVDGGNGCTTVWVYFML